MRFRVARLVRVEAMRARAVTPMKNSNSLAGRQQEARDLFTHLLALRNQLGLLAEGYESFARRTTFRGPLAAQTPVRRSTEPCGIVSVPL